MPSFPKPTVAYTYDPDTEVGHLRARRHEREEAMGLAITMAILIVIENGIGIWFAWRYGLEGRPLSAALVATACTAFVFLLGLSNWKVTEASMRSAIAGTIVLVYLVLLGIVAFFSPTSAEGLKLHELTQTFVTNFTTLIGVIVAFYFSSSAYL